MLGMGASIASLETEKSQSSKQIEDLESELDKLMLNGGTFEIDQQ